MRKSTTVSPYVLVGALITVRNVQLDGFISFFVVITTGFRIVIVAPVCISRFLASPFTKSLTRMLLIFLPKNAAVAKIFGTSSLLVDNRFQFFCNCLGVSWGLKQQFFKCLIPPQFQQRGLQSLFLKPPAPSGHSPLWKESGVLPWFPSTARTRAVPRTDCLTDSNSTACIRASFSVRRRANIIARRVSASLSPSRKLSVAKLSYISTGTVGYALLTSRFKLLLLYLLQTHAESHLVSETGFLIVSGTTVPGVYSRTTSQVI